MRKPGFYWAKHKNHTEEEVIHFKHSDCVTSTRHIGIYSENEFEWISDNLIRPEKAPIKLIPGLFYIVEGTSNIPEIMYWTGHLFHNIYRSLKKEDAKVLSGPFNSRELVSK